MEKNEFECSTVVSFFVFCFFPVRVCYIYGGNDKAFDDRFGD